jgi:hypothetical protein
VLSATFAEGDNHWVGGDFSPNSLHRRGTARLRGRSSLYLTSGMTTLMSLCVRYHTMNLHATGGGRVQNLQKSRTRRWSAAWGGGHRRRGWVWVREERGGPAEDPLAVLIKPECTGSTWTSPGGGIVDGWARSDRAHNISQPLIADPMNQIAYRFEL